MAVFPPAMNTEPALIMGAIEALIVLAIAFGAPVTADQKTAIVTAASALVMVIGSLVVREHVTPVAAVPPVVPPVVAP